MSNPCFPPEMLDNIIDFLSNNPDALRQCCLASKSMVSRARKHLFAQITFNDGDYPKWKEVFPVPKNSPAYHVHTLTISCDTRSLEGRWVQCFSRVERLIISGSASRFPDLFIRFCESPCLKSLHVSSTILHPNFFILLRSLPLLEDLNLGSNDTASVNIWREQEEWPTFTFPSTSPPLIGTLDLRLFEEMAQTVQGLLDLPGGLHFQSLNIWCDWGGELHHVAKLVAACSNTLERLEVGYAANGTSTLLLL